MDGLNWMQFAIVRAARQSMTAQEVRALPYWEADPALRKRMIATCWQIAGRRAKVRNAALRRKHA